VRSQWCGNLRSGPAKSSVAILNFYGTSISLNCSTIEVKWLQPRNLGLILFDKILKLLGKKMHRGAVNLQRILIIVTIIPILG
jgi:hypothetical protein